MPARDRLLDSLGGRARPEQIVMRIGLISDTHIPEACEHLPEKVFEVFANIDLVMHAGDVYVNRVLDELSAIAPVIAALANGDEGLDGHRYRLNLAAHRLPEPPLLDTSALPIRSSTPL